MTVVSSNTILALLRAGLLGGAVPDMLVTLRDRGRRVAQGWVTDIAGLAAGVAFTTVEVTFGGGAIVTAGDILLAWGILATADHSRLCHPDREPVAR